jgi:DNA modification methylase
MARERVNREGQTYLVVRVATGRPVTDRDRDVVRIINTSLPKKVVFIEFQEGSLVCYLHTLSIDAFRDAVRDAVERVGHDCGNGDGDPFTQLVREVEGIGSYGVRGEKRVFVGYNGERKVEDRSSKTKKRGAVYYAKDHPFSTERNEIPDGYTNTVLCGDAEQVLKALPDNCVDLVFTSPPYNFGLAYGSTGDEDAWESYFQKLFAVLDECVRVLVFGGRIVVNVQPLFSDYIPSHHLVSRHLMEKRLIWKGEILWEKNNYNCKYTAWGSWKSPASPYLKYTWEFLEIFSKGDLKKAGSPENADITADEFKEWVVARWSIAPERKMKELGHPAVFPEALATRVLKLFSFSGDVILDPFNGVGTTTAVARRLRRRALGIDIDPGYCETARRRMEAEEEKMRQGRQVTLGD